MFELKIKNAKYHSWTKSVVNLDPTDGMSVFCTVPRTVPESSVCLDLAT